MSPSFVERFEPYDLPAFERGVRLPEIVVPTEAKTALGLRANASNTTYLKKLCWARCQQKLVSGRISQPKDLCVARLKTEFDVFEKTGVIDYVLLLLDIFGWCDGNSIPRGVARGSAAGSFALFCLDLISINALDHGLHFTRFLNEARVKPKFLSGVMFVDGNKIADFDGDVSYLHRPRLMQRIDETYAGRTAKIATVQYLTGKMAVKEALKSYLEYSEEHAREVTNHIEAVFGKVQSISDACKESPLFKAFADANPKVIAIARKMEGLINAFGVHASGVLISHSDIQKLIPLELSSNDKTLTVVSGYAMEHVLTVIAKIDALGLRTVDQIDLVCKAVGTTTAVIDVNDPSIYAFYERSSEFYGLFQIEDGLTKSVIQRVKPKNIDQLASCISISRPGSLRYIDDYVKFVQTGDRKLIHPLVDDLLKPTGGLILYQEQINSICQAVYKMSAVDADEVRYAIGKKKRDEMAKWEPVIYANGKQEDIPEEVTKWFWDTCSASADYLFNANHCYSYSYITAYTTYLKANHPIEFYWAALKLASAEIKPHDCIATIEMEMKKVGYRLLPPDIRESEIDFKIESPTTIRYAFGLIRGISEGNLEKVALFCSAKRDDLPNKFETFQSMKNAGLNVGIAAALVQAGCLSAYETYRDKEGREYRSRSRLVLELCMWSRGDLLKDKERLACLGVGGKPEVQWDVLRAIKYLAEVAKDEKGKPVIKETRLATIKKHYQPYKEIFEQNSRNERLANYYYEKRVLGYSYSETLQEIFAEHIDGLVAVTDVKELKPNTSCRLIGFVSEPYKGKTQKGNAQFKFTLKDDTGEIAVKAFNERIDAIAEQNGRLPEKEDLVVVNCKKMEGDTVFVQAGLDGTLIGIQSTKIYMRLSELRDSKAKDAAAKEPEPAAEGATPPTTSP